MAYDIALAVLPHRTLESVGASGPASSFVEAASTTAEALSAAQVGPHVVFADPMFGEMAKAVVGGAQIFLVILGGTADQYVIQALGPLERLRVQLAGELVEDTGVPLGAEAALTEDGDAEDAHIAVLERLAGASFAEIQNAEFHAVIQAVPAF
jgi:hypothetical protein